MVNPEQSIPFCSRTFASPVESNPTLWVKRVRLENLITIFDQPDLVLAVRLVGHLHTQLQLMVLTTCCHPSCA